jgi:hypothetical protein
MPRDLDGVLDRLSAGVEQRGALIVRTGGDPVEQVWVKWATCSVTRVTTSSALLPTDVTAIPDPKSISEFPSASISTPPPAAVTKIGSTWLSPRATLRCRRSSSSRETGPGISVTRWRC